MKIPNRALKTPPSLIEGSAFNLGDYIDADAIIPVRYCTRPTPDVLVKRCLTAIDTDFPEKARRGTVLVAGLDFGRGSANENGVRALQLCGVKAVIAKSFGPLFWRNAINLGLPVFECSEIIENTETGDSIRIDFENRRCANITAGVEANADPISPVEKQILDAGGIIGWAKLNSKTNNKEEAKRNEL